MDGYLTIHAIIPIGIDHLQPDLHLIASIKRIITTTLIFAEEVAFGATLPRLHLIHLI
jgi:hypothetical protein